MYRISSLLPTAFFAVLFAASGFGQTIVVAETKWDFGNVEQGHRSLKTIPIRNTGDKVLTIKRTTVSCGCLTVTTSSTFVQPKKEVDLVISLDTARVTGPIAKQVLIECDDPKNPAVPVAVEGSIYSAWTVAPININFGEVEPSKRVEKTFRLTILPKQPIKLVGFYSSTPRLLIDKKPFSIEDGTNGFDFSIRLAPETPKGPFYATIAIETDSKSLPIQEVIVTARVLGTVVARPETLAFGASKEGVTRTLKVTIEKAAGDPLTIEKISSSDTAVTTTVTEVTAGRAYLVEVNWTPVFGRNAMGKLFIVTNDPNEKLIVIPFNGAAYK